MSNPCRFDQLVEHASMKQALRKLTPEEFESLEADIRESGITDPIVVWNRNGRWTIVDGHNRFFIATRLIASGDMRDEDVPIRERHFQDDFHAIQWIQKHQLARRNLNEKEASLMRAAELGEIAAGIEEEPHQEKKKAVTKKKAGRKSTAKRTAVKKVAEKHDVSERTVERDEKLQNAIDAFTEAGVDQDVIDRAISDTRKSLGKTQLVKIATEVDPKHYEDALRRKLGDITDEELQPKDPQREAWIAAMKTMDRAVEQFCKAAKDPALIYDKYPAELLDFMAALNSESWIRYLQKNPFTGGEADSKIGTSQVCYQLARTTKGVRQKKDAVESLPFKSKFHAYVVKQS